MFARRSYGQLCLLTGDADGARAEIDIAYEIARHIPASLEHAPAVRAKAALLACEKRFEESYALAREALASARPVDEIVECHVTLSALALELDRDDEARIHAEEAVTVARRLESPRLICVAELALGRWQMRFAPAAARASLLSALDHTDATRFPLERAEVLTSLADCLRAQQGAPEDTAQLEAEAQSIMHRLRASIAAPVAALRA